MNQFADKQLRFVLAALAVLMVLSMIVADRVPEVRFYHIAALVLPALVLLGVAWMFARKIQVQNAERLGGYAEPKIK